VEKFVDWVATMPSTQVDDVKKQLALVRSDPKVVDAIAGKLSFSNPGSYGRQLIYLSMLGEMKNERALSPLQEYLNSRDCLVFEERLVAHPPAGGPRKSFLDACAGLKSAAAKMIAYLNSPAAQNVILKTISEHASRTVRLSAIDAYLYNNGDSVEAVAKVRQYVRPEELMFVGLPRLSPETDRADFGTRLARFYREHPGELAPELKRIQWKGHQGKPEHRSNPPKAEGGNVK
jgi:hypothetical protein